MQSENRRQNNFQALSRITNMKAAEFGLSIRHVPSLLAVNDITSWSNG